MKKNGIIWIVLTIVVAFAFTSCSSVELKTYEKDFVLTNPNNLHDILLNRIDLSYRDLNLTNDELAAVQKYSKYGNVLRAATYGWPGKSEEIDYLDSRFFVGVDKFELEAISKILGINIEIEQMRFDEAIEKIETGQIDMLPGVYLTPEIESKGILIESNTVTDYIYAYSVDPIEINNILDLDGLAIGTLKNFNIINDELKSSFEESRIDYEIKDDYDTEYHAITALRNGEIDVLFQTFSSYMLYYETRAINISQIFDENSTKIIFTSKNDNLLNLISAIEKVYKYDEYMLNLKQDYMDMYAEMALSTGSAFTDAEQYCINLETVNILAASNSEPYVYYNECSGEWSGVTYELWDEVAKVVGLDYNIEQSEYESNELFDMVSNESFPEDTFIIMPMYKSQDKDEFLVFSEPVLSDKFVVVGMSGQGQILSISDLANKKIGVIPGYDATKALKSYLPHEEYIDTYATNDELVADLNSGIIDYIVLSETEFNDYFFERRYYDMEIVYEDLADAESSIAFINDHYGLALQSIYNKVIPFVKSEYIKDKYISIEQDITSIMNTRNRDMMLMFSLMFIVVIVFLGFFLRRLTKANKQVREIAFVNTITGLQNRTSFYNENTLATGSLIYIDIDNFKRINELYGHDIGDMYAYEIAQRISSIAAENQMRAYTMQIDSFLLLDDGSNNEDKLVSISAKILYEVTKPVRIYDVDHKQTASIGIAPLKDEKGMEELFKKADTALYLAKERGKNRYVIASEEEFIAYRKRQFLTDQLSKETVQKEIVPYYQAKVDIRDGKIIGIEALARWNAKEQGMIYPKEILPILSESGILPILDISILTKSCRDYMKWLDQKIIESHIIVSCNMSYETVEKFDIVAAIKQIHDNLGMPYRSLELELKEQDFINHLPVINDKLIELAKLGVNIAIDNFKAEHSIMTQIAKLPVNVIKVDRTLLRGGVVKKTRELLELISTLSSNLNLGLIIEGVETAEQIQLLKEIPIYRVQGYYYGEAVEKSKIENDLRVKYIYR